MANPKYTSSGTVVAEPEPITLDWSKTAFVIIDMQRDFMEPGGFGETLGNDVSQLARAVKPIGAVLSACRDTGILVIHTREGHLPDHEQFPDPRAARSRIVSRPRCSPLSGVRSCSSGTKPRPSSDTRRRIRSSSKLSAMLTCVARP